MRRTILILVVALVPCLAAASQPETLALRVRDPQRAPVAGARVTVNASSGRTVATAETARDGGCALPGLAAGDYLLSVEKDGFSRFGPRRVRVGAPGPAILDVVLALGGVREEVVVTAADGAQASGEVSKSVSVITRRELDARGDVALADVLRPLPGLRVQQLGAAGAATSIATRGMRGRDTAVLIDGVRFRDPSGPQGDASDLLSDVLVTDVDRVEVLRGSGSSLYGSHAIGGVVHLLSGEYAGRPTAGLVLEGGTLGLFHGRLHAKGGAFDDRVTGSLGVARLDRRDGLDRHDSTRNTSLQSSVRLRLPAGASLTARLYASAAARDLDETPATLGVLPDGIPTAVPLSRPERERFESGVAAADLRLEGANFVPAADDPDSRRESRFGSLLLRLEQQLTACLGYAVAYQRLDTTRVFFEGPLGVSGFEPETLTRSAYRGSTDTVTARADVSLGRGHLLTAGYELEREHLEDELEMDGPSASSRVTVSQQSHAFFFQERTRLLGDRLQLALGGRLQSFDLRAPRFAPAEGAPYQGVALGDPPSARTLDGSLAYAIPSSGTRLRVHVGTGYRAPSLFERFGSGYWTSAYSPYGDPRLSPERSLGVDAALDQSFADGKLRISAGAFHTRVEDTIAFDFSGAIDPASDPFGRSAGYRSEGSGQASGIELTAEATPSASARLSAAYTFVAAPSPSGVTDAPRALGVPRHQVSLVAFAGLGRRLTTTFQLVALSDVLHRIGSRVLRFEAQVRADTQLSYRVPLGARQPLRLQLRVENILGHAAYESGFPTPGRTITAGLALGL